METILTLKQIQKRNWYLRNREKVLEYNKRWKLENRDKDHEHNKRWRQSHKDEFRNMVQDWRKRNPDKCKQYKHNRRARELGDDGSILSEEWASLCEYYGYTCLCCKRMEPEIKLTVDHVVPVSKGGKNKIENIQPLCGSCTVLKELRL